MGNEIKVKTRKDEWDDFLGGVFWFLIFIAFIAWLIARFVDWYASIPTDIVILSWSGIAFSVLLITWLKIRGRRKNRAALQLCAQNLYEKHREAFHANYTDYVGPDEFGHIDYSDWYARLHEIVGTKLMTQELAKALKKTKRSEQYFYNTLHDLIKSAHQENGLPLANRSRI